MIWIVLPIYNEEGAIARLLRAIQKELKKAGLDFSVIAVNDGSSDKTAKILEDFSKQMRVYRVEHPKNEGLGQTIRDGLLSASEKAKEADWIVTLDADNTHSPAYIPGLLEKAVKGCDLVIASRYQREGEEKGLPFSRSLYSRMINTILGIRFPVAGVRDYTCGYRLYSAKIIKKAFTCYGKNGFVEEKGFLCMAEILLKLRALDLKAGEVGFVLRYDRKTGPSKMKVLKTILGYFRLLVRFKGLV